MTTPNGPDPDRRTPLGERRDLDAKRRELLAKIEAAKRAPSAVELARHEAKASGHALAALAVLDAVVRPRDLPAALGIVGAHVEAARRELEAGLSIPDLAKGPRRAEE